VIEEIAKAGTSKFVVSSNISRVRKLWRTRWQGHVECTGRMINAYKILVLKLKVKYTSKKNT
jgi:hypothetical protein